MDQLTKLEETIYQVMHTLEFYQQQVKKSFDKKATTKVFLEGVLVLKWNVDRAKQGRHSMFDTMWSGPYIITSCKEANAFSCLGLFVKLFLSNSMGYTLNLVYKGILNSCT